MADTMNRQSDSQNSSPNQTMQHEQAKASVSGSQDEQGNMREEQREKSAIGGGETRSQTERGQQSGEMDRERSQLGQSGERSETGEPGRARNELDSQR